MIEMHGIMNPMEPYTKTARQENSSSSNLQHTQPVYPKREPILRNDGNMFRTSAYDPSLTGAMYRSNSNLELHDSASTLQCANLNVSIKRVSSHGSIDMMIDKPQDVFARKMAREANLQNIEKCEVNGLCAEIEKNNQNSDSPKFNLKLKLWNQMKSATTSKSQSATHEESKEIAITSSTVIATSADMEERARRRAFAHFDCQSLMVNLGYAARLRGMLLSRRRNTTTGASAAAMYSTRSSTPDADEDEKEEKLCNELVEVCPFFRNELGGELERNVGLSRINSISMNNELIERDEFHLPKLAYGVSIVECPFGETLWKKQSCPYERNSSLIEQNDNGAFYYRKYFFEQEHQNWFGMDEQLGPVAISIKKEKPIHQPLSSDPNHQQHLYRIIVRTSELNTLRGSIFEDSIPNPRGTRGKNISTKDILDYVAPEVQSTCLRQAISSVQCQNQILKLDEQGISNKYKVGILYCREGQATEEDMYNNMESGSAFAEFLESIGKVVKLKGFQHYKGGLDTKTDSTGTHSVYATYANCEVMFHVSTMLPYTPNNRQQLLRKRHIGNDIVTIIFQEPGAKPFTPKNIRSQFQHVFIVVRVLNPNTENTLYHVAVTRSKELSIFGPPLKKNAIYSKGKKFTEFLLSKILNAENAAHKSKKFATMATRTRQEYLKDLCSNYVTQMPLDSGQKFSIFSSKKKEPYIPRFSGDASQRGAFCWQIILDDYGLTKKIDCFLGISSETFVLIEESTQKVIFVIPNRSLLGWTTNGNALRIFYHQGECLTINMNDARDRDEQLEVIERLRAVSCGTGTLELNLQRNSLGQLGFHLQPDGIVTTVEINGPAWAAGLRQGYRLVEICKVAIATLSHDQMVDLLKTSLQVTVTVIESHPDFTPRRGCFLQNCKFNAINYEYDISQSFPKMNNQMYNESNSHTSTISSSGYETPNTLSIGYVTGDIYKKSYMIPDIGTMTSSSSGHSSEDKWYCYDFLENNKTEADNSRSLYQMNSNFTPKESKLAKEHPVNHEVSADFPDSSKKMSRETPPHVHKDLKYKMHTKLTEEQTPSAATSSSSSKPNKSSSQAFLADLSRRPLSLRLPNQNRHSTYAYTSSLQEDLIKLISPEYLNSENFDDTRTNNSSNSSPMKSTTTNDMSVSYGGLQKSSTDKELKNLEGLTLKDETIVTTARPATIVSSDFPSSAYAAKLTPTKSMERNKSEKSKVVMTSSQLKDSPVSHLHDSQIPGCSKSTHNSSSSESNSCDEGNFYESATSSSTLPELQTQVTKLSDRVLKETRRRKSLEVAVKKLTEENKRLQDESQQAVLQLKRFTEWFFQTVDNKHK